MSFLGICVCVPVSRGRVARLGLGLMGGRVLSLSCVVARFRRALERRRTVPRPVSGSLWMNFFSTYLERIHDSLSCLRKHILIIYMYSKQNSVVLVMISTAKHSNIYFNHDNSLNEFKQHLLIYMECT